METIGRVRTRPETVLGRRRRWAAYFAFRRDFVATSCPSVLFLLVPALLKRNTLSAWA